MLRVMKPGTVAWRAAPFGDGIRKTQHVSMMRMPSWKMVGSFVGSAGGGTAEVELKVDEISVGDWEEQGIEDVSTEMEEGERKLLWKAAIKLPMYWVAVIPVLMGASLSVFQQSSLNFGQLGSLLLSAVLIIAWLNLSNDAFDANTGVDKNKKESIVNLTGKPGLVLWLSIVMLISGVCLLVHSLGTLNQITSSCLLGLAIACGYIYQGPPFRLSYKGVGEPLCFFAFGPFATIAFYLAMLQTPATLFDVPVAAWICSTLVGLTTAIVLFCSHFHQYEDDKMAGKLSPIVRLGGAGPGTKVLGYLSSILYAILGCAVIAGALPPFTLLVMGLLTIPKYMKLNKFAKTNHHDVKMISKLKLLALELHSTFGLTLCCTLVSIGIYF